MLAADGRVSERANIKLRPTSDYIERVRISHENAGVPPNSPFEDVRRLCMGARYPEVPDSWEDMPKDSSSENALATLASTQAGEAMVEVATGTLEATQVQPPVSVTVTSQSPAKRTKSTVSFRQTTLESFLPILGNTPSLEKRLILPTPHPLKPLLRKNNASNL